MRTPLDQLARLASEHEQHNRLQPALACAKQALSQDPGHPLASLVAARCARRAGALEQALGHLDQVGHARREPAHTHESARILDKQGQHTKALEAFAQANAALRAEHPDVDRSLMPRFIAHITDCFTEDWVKTWTPLPASPRPAPLFMVGFNRSGTTLLDRILDAHPQVHVLEEVAAIDQARRTLGALYPRGLADLEPVQLQAAREAYFAVVDAHIPDDFDGLVVDKLPLSTIALGLIHRLFPSAKAVFSLRHPADVVLSNFMQHYTPNPITCHFDSLKSAAKLYAQVMGLGCQLRQVLPMPILEIRYEDLVEDWEPEMRRLLEFAALPWDDEIRGYLARTQNQGQIGTPSYDQVVEPIHRRAVGRRHNYAQAIAHVADVLQPYIDAFGYGTDKPD